MDRICRLVDSTTYVKRLLSGDMDATITGTGFGQKFPTGISLNSAYRLANNPMWPGGLPPKDYLDAVSAVKNTVDLTQEAATPPRARSCLKSLG